MPKISRSARVEDVKPASVDDLLSVTSKIVAALKPIPVDQRSRVLRSALTLLGMSEAQIRDVMTPDSPPVMPGVHYAGGRIA